MQYVTPTKKGKKRRKEAPPPPLKRTMYKFTGIAPELNYLDCAKNILQIRLQNKGNLQNSRR